MKSWKLTHWILLTCILITPALSLAGEDNEAFHALLEKEWAFRMEEYPESASGNGIKGYENRLTRVAVADQKRRYRYWQGILAELDAMDCEALGRADCINYRMFRRQISHFVTDFEQKGYLIPFNSDWGFWMSWARLPEDTVFRKSSDYSDYLSRLSQMAAVMDEYIGLMREGLNIGMTQPRAVLTGRDVSIANHVVETVTESAFYSPFVELPETMPEAQQEQLRARARLTVQDSVIPAYRKLLKFFRQEYLPGARETLGAAFLPGGADFYAEQIHWYVTIDLTAEEIHQTGLSEVARIRKEMDEIIHMVGFEGSFAEFIEFLRTDPQFYAKTPHQLLAEASYIAKKADGRLPKLFGRLPRQPYGIAAVPEDLAPFYTTGRAVGAPLDADHGGYYWVNTYLLDKRPLYALAALTLHEAAPGHLMQGGLALELGEQPPFRRYDYISAYGEGWGLYSEKLGLELDIYETPYDHFGRLTYEMWRACRLVIDTGVHSMGWTREQAQDYLASNTALSLHNVHTEVDRYISWPGQALSYKLGELTLWRLREAAQKTLGNHFDVRKFHDFVLSLGSVPLDVLEDEVMYWVKSQTGESATPG
jgi:uncharacterized protein (DUF885 family)